MLNKRFLKRTPAKGRTAGRKKGMNNLEKAYSLVLEGRVCAGEVVEFGFESLKFKLASNTFYEPDFWVLLADGTFEIHEVKGGHWEDDARAKIKIAAEKFPFRFIAATRPGNTWQFEKFFNE